MTCIEKILSGITFDEAIFNEEQRESILRKIKNTLCCGHCPHHFPVLGVKKQNCPGITCQSCWLREVPEEPAND